VTTCGGRHTIHHWSPYIALANLYAASAPIGISASGRGEKHLLDQSITGYDPERLCWALPDDSGKIPAANHTRDPDCSANIIRIDASKFLELAAPEGARSRHGIVHNGGEVVAIRISSRCAFILQIYDRGKNRANVALVERELQPD
jgi:hypothetical protein